jgi:hypothetical protein
MGEYHDLMATPPILPTKLLLVSVVNADPKKKKRKKEKKWTRSKGKEEDLDILRVTWEITKSRV